MKESEPLIQALKRDKRINVLRRMVHGGFALFCLYAGYRFYQYYLWASSQSDTYVSRPPSVEAFLPISALVNLKRLVLTGQFDTIHPAGLTIFMAALVIALVLRKGFCGWICPVGFASNLAEVFSRRFKLLLNPPAWIDYPLLTLKYLLLFFFSYLILLKMDIASIEDFNRSTYNLVVDAKMLFFFLAPSTLSMWILIFLVAISFFLRNFWCRYLCPYGALLGILAIFSPLKVYREEQNCIDCKKCDRICPGAIKISREKVVRTPECIGCGECVSVCPAKDCLSLSAPGIKRLPLLTLPAGVLVVFFLFYGWAVVTGHWHSEISPELMKLVYSVTPLEKLEHP
jgi:polyferredoxin